jgi:prepilin-type N-terminal cleavage/methylation domain-containing protein
MNISSLLSFALRKKGDGEASFVGNLGFTMIELLVVIAVIGVLAVAVLSSINPIEQINKGRDTRLRSDSEQLINAAERYFAIHEEYPWDTVNGTTAEDEYTHNNGAGEWDWLQNLVDTAEVKVGFTNRLQNDDQVRVFKAADENSTMYACYLPSSQAFKLEAMRNCAQGTTPDRGAAEVPNNAIDPCEDETDAAADNYICLP